MRPVRLEFCGVNSFSEPAEIDFANLLQFGIFGIFGDTGSGKSTILDCIAFALYGEATRSRTGSAADLINDRLDRAYVNFEFEIVFEGSRRSFRVEREIKRKNAAQSVRVWERKGETLSALAEGVRECNALLERIIGLEQKDFEKCIALPQGEFAKFVQEKRSDRLKLISRLFDLEQYGERLVKRVNARAAEAGAEARLASARLEPFAEVSEESNAALVRETEALRGRESALSAALARAREEEKRLAALLELRREKERTAARLRALEARSGEMAALGEELSRLGRAAAVVAAAKEGARLRGRAEDAQAELVRAKEWATRAEDAQRALPADGAAQIDGELERLSEERARAVAAKETAERKAALERECSALSERYAAEERVPAFDYAAEKKALDGELAALGEGDLLRFLGERGKEALFKGEYAEFARELEELTARHPAIGADSAPLIQKYTSLAQSGGDIDTLRREYAERERRRKQCADRLIGLEQRRGQYELHLQRLAQLGAERKRAEEELAACEEKLAGAPLLLEEIDGALSRRRREKRELTERTARVREDCAKAAASLAAAGERAAAARTALEESRARYREALAAGGFSDDREAGELVEKYGDAKAAEEKLSAYRAEVAAVRARNGELEGRDCSEASEERLAKTRADLAAAEKEYRTVGKELALKEDSLRRGVEALAQKRILAEREASARAARELYEKLKKLFENNRFMEFAAEEYLQTVARNASGRLLGLTDGRYFLRYEGGFFVGDNFNGGKLRAVSTLSGGETFLVSLSLALALSAEICAKSLRPIEFFFLDEGFGTLDARLVDTVMDSLEKLKSENFSIGIISHVEELKHRIDRKLSVKKATEKRGSQIQTE